MKLTPKLKLITNRDQTNKKKLVLASIERIPSSISAKSQKEVNQISKYFKNIKLTSIIKFVHKSYVQVSKLTSNTAEVIKIKNTFPALGTKKIDQIQNIIKSGPKSKLYI